MCHPRDFKIITIIQILFDTWQRKIGSKKTSNKCPMGDKSHPPPPLKKLDVTKREDKNAHHKCHVSKMSQEMKHLKKKNTSSDWKKVNFLFENL